MSVEENPIANMHRDYENLQNEMVRIQQENESAKEKNKEVSQALEELCGHYCKYRLILTKTYSINFLYHDFIGKYLFVLKINDDIFLFSSRHIIRIKFIPKLKKLRNKGLNLGVNHSSFESRKKRTIEITNFCSFN